MQQLSRSNMSLTADGSYYALASTTAQTLHMPVYSIDTLRCEILGDGDKYLVINATGTTISTGWYAPCLMPHSYLNNKPLDGFWEFDFCCLPPHSKVIQQPVAITATLNWYEFSIVQRDLQGIRVIAQTNSLSFSFSALLQ